MRYQSRCSKAHKEISDASVKRLECLPRKEMMASSSEGMGTFPVAILTTSSISYIFTGGGARARRFSVVLHARAGSSSTEISSSVIDDNEGHLVTVVLA